jgi:predicted hydrocarbon binding protein
MTLRTAKVPAAFAPPFEKAEEYVSGLFADFQRRPEEGTVRIGGERYVILRCQSLFVAWFDALEETFGEVAAREFIYNTAREIGRSDSGEFAKRLHVTDGVERLSAGPIHFAHAGWAFVEILEDSAPATDDSYYLHYYHPNTFESEVLASLGRRTTQCACLFSAGYSAGWCSEAFGLDVHGREVRCTARGDAKCEFIMAPAARLDEREKKLT